VIFYYNIKAGHFFANLHLTGLCLYRSTVLLELIGVKELTFISWDMLIEIHVSLFRVLYSSYIPGYFSHITFGMRLHFLVLL